MARTSTPLPPKARIPRHDDGASREVVLRLLAGFGVEVKGEEVALPGSAQRVVAFVALHERPVLRPYVAGPLWLDWPETRAAGNLQSALWRIQQHAPELVAADPHMLRLAPGVRVDLREAETLAHSELAGSSSGIAQRPLAWTSCRTGTRTGSSSSVSASGSCACVRSSAAARDSRPRAGSTRRSRPGDSSRVELRLRSRCGSCRGGPRCPRSLACSA